MLAGFNPASLLLLEAPDSIQTGLSDDSGSFEVDVPISEALPDFANLGLDCVQILEEAEQAERDIEVGVPFIDVVYLALNPLFWSGNGYLSRSDRMFLIEFLDVRASNWLLSWVVSGSNSSTINIKAD